MYQIKQKGHGKHHVGDQHMKMKLNKKLSLALAMALMLVALNPMSALAAEKWNIQYLNTDNPALTNASANTTITLSGTLADAPGSIDFKGQNNSLDVVVNNLPAHYENGINFRYYATLENGYSLELNTSFDIYPAGVFYTIYNPNDIQVWDTWMEIGDDSIFQTKYQNGVSYDFANMYLNLMLACTDGIITLLQYGLTYDEIDPIINESLKGTNAYIGWNCYDETFPLMTMQYKIKTYSMFVGVDYTYNNGWGVYFEDTTADAPETPVPEVPTVPETPAPTVNTTGLACVFNSTDYAKANPDLAAVFGNDETLLTNHFLLSGMAEGRQGSAEFNVHVYKQYNPDLAAVFGNDFAAYYHHYINCGKAEGRIAR